MTPRLFSLFALIASSLILPLSADELGELTTARANYEKALDKATAPIHEKYLQHLKALQAGFTRTNNLDAALVIRGEIEAIEGVMRGGESGMVVSIEEESVELSETERFKEWLQGREFRWNGSTVKEVTMQFSDDTVLVEADGNKLTETTFEIISPTAFQFVWSNGDMNTFTVDERKRDFVRFMEGSKSSHPGTIHARSKL